MRRASAMPCKVNPNVSTWWRPYASDWSHFETRRFNSSWSKQDHENIIVESRSIRTTKRKEKTRQEHIADRGQVSMSHYNMLHKLDSRSKTVEIPAANVPLDRDWRKWRKNQLSLCCTVINTTIHLVGRTLPQQYIHHTCQLRFFLALKALSINGKRDLTLHSPVV